MAVGLCRGFGKNTWQSVGSRVGSRINEGWFPKLSEFSLGRVRKNMSGFRLSRVRKKTYGIRLGRIRKNISGMTCTACDDMYLINI